MKNKIPPFIKKYPMSILLAIIALNLMSIARSLGTEARINQKKLICLEQQLYTKEELEKKLISKPWHFVCEELFE